MSQSGSPWTLAHCLHGTMRPRSASSCTGECSPSLPLAPSGSGSTGRVSWPELYLGVSLCFCTLFLPYFLLRLDEFMDEVIETFLQDSNLLYILPLPPPTTRIQGTEVRGFHEEQLPTKLQLPGLWATVHRRVLRPQGVGGAVQRFWGAIRCADHQAP